METPEKRSDAVEDQMLRGHGRPKGPESTEVNIRVPRELLDRLDQYIAHRLQWSHDADIDRTTVTREALEALLTEKGF